jgi:hypothetical protein
VQPELNLQRRRELDMLKETLAKFEEAIKETKAAYRQLAEKELEAVAGGGSAGRPIPTGLPVPCC